MGPPADKNPGPRPPFPASDEEASEWGEREAVKEEIKQQEIETIKFDETVHQGSHVLYKTKAIFPFDLFPDEITVDLNQVNVVIKYFFWSERRQSILIKDIMDVLVDTIPFFASLKVIDSGFKEQPIEINFLKRNDAIKIRRLIQGLMVAHKQEIDLSKIDSHDLPEKIEELGKVTEIE